MTLKQLDHVLEGMYYDRDTHVLAKDLRRVLAGFCREAAEAFNRKRFENAPCYICGYNGGNYYQPDVHKCAAFYHGDSAPVAPPPSPSPDATEKGGDRAAQVADGLLLAYSTWSGSGPCEKDRAQFEHEIALALRAYGDELLERAAVKTTLTVCSDKDCECDDCEAHRHDAAEIRAMKSSATKGATNG